MQIQLFATYRDLAKAKVVDVPVTESITVKQLLQALVNLVPDFQHELFIDETQSQLKPHVHLFVNGRNIIHLQGLETPISANDEIALIPPVGGG
ncbi:ubiquitin-like small modifier protein 1 [Tepidibacillus fermentans]|uniref:Molybdopterin synthase subunit MoaD n=1 Tax=Tepidibacillus fermentans TaxID=1281767 RepID=A0A4R3KKW7_9BACI|nr:ubiquitin-like small modifier protein 1 [Tepidibacillus fermentans]TCS84533.1 molybdopterin synthase subunit MoaD [Tepidibacillus fermentans]